MISVTCPSCKRVHKADDSLLGHRVKCNACGAAFEVTSDEPQPVQQPNDGEGEQIAAAVPMAIAGIRAALDERAKAEQMAPERRGADHIPYESMMLPQDGSPAIDQRTFGVVWIAFYFILVGLNCVISGPILAFAGSALSGAAEARANMFGSRGFGGPTPETWEGALIEFGGVVTFHLGLLFWVASYGLWTFRRWGLSLARGLALASVVLALIGLVASVYARAGIVVFAVGFAISAQILIYLYGSANLRDRLQRYIRSAESQGGAWDQYR